MIIVHRVKELKFIQILFSAYDCCLSVRTHTWTYLHHAYECILIFAKAFARSTLWTYLLHLMHEYNFLCSLLVFFCCILCSFYTPSSPSSLFELSYFARYYSKCVSTMNVVSISFLPFFSLFISIVLCFVECASTQTSIPFAMYVHLWHNKFHWEEHTIFWTNSRWSLTIGSHGKHSTGILMKTTEMTETKEENKKHQKPTDRSN